MRNVIGVVEANLAATQLHAPIGPGCESVVSRFGEDLPIGELSGLCRLPGHSVSCKKMARLVSGPGEEVLRED